MIDIIVQAQLDPKAAILRLLKDERKTKINLKGLNIQEISELLKITRPTVVKYCRMLNGEGLLIMKKTGRNKVYYAKKFMEVNGRLREGGIANQGNQ
jgi:Mn-dependent DtxR family transcriptional regulator